MWQKILLQSKKKLPNKGFLTLEIIVATLVAFFFLMFSLQALTLSMFMKVKAQEDQRADQLIQEDIERVGSLSSILPFDLITCNAANYNNGYANALWLALEADTPPTSPDLTASLLTPGAGGATGTTLSLDRTHISAIGNNGFFSNLRIFYQVTNDDNEIIASRYLETIPDAALRCP